MALFIARNIVSYYNQYRYILMKKKRNIIREIKAYLKERPKLSIAAQYAYSFFMCVISAFMVGLSFRLFVAPAELPEGQIYFVTGGVSGLAQNIVKFVADILKVQNVNRSLLQSILYFSLNIPVMLLGWFKIGRRFTFFSVMNVFLTSLFISIIPVSWEKAVIIDSQLTRTLFAGILAGFAGAIALKSNVSRGGMDIVSYYFANKKSTDVGKYSVILNGVVLIIFFILNLFDENPSSNALTAVIYSVLYLVMSSIVIDAIHIRNKKTQLQIFTSNEELAKALINNFPHGATTVGGIGVYSSEAKTIIYMTVSSNEVNDAVTLIRELDPKAFINVIDVRQIHGKFFIPPIK